MKASNDLFNASETLLAIQNILQRHIPLAPLEKLYYLCSLVTKRHTVSFQISSPLQTVTLHTKWWGRVTETMKSGPQNIAIGIRGKPKNVVARIKCNMK